MYIPRILSEKLNKYVQPNKVLVLYGARRVGKTTLLKNFLATQRNTLLVSGEDIDVQHYLSSQSIAKLQQFVGSHTLLAVDEAQKVPNIGINLKLLVDHCPGLAVMATGSSSFDLAHHLGEPLTGRKNTLLMFPLAQMELASIENNADTRANLENRLLYGAYPDVVTFTDNSDKRTYLQELVSSYLYKDIIELEGIRKAKKITQMLQLLAFQIGKDVSLSEIGTQIGLHKDTISHYLDLLEKSFVLFNVTAYSRNLRKEITSKSRFYFYDVGVRNAVINQFNSIGTRNDLGELWENYLVVERLKKQYYTETRAANYFWRTYDGQEIDWIEERDGALNAYEFKWQKPFAKIPAAWQTAYPDSQYTVINNSNYLDFITERK